MRRLVSMLFPLSILTLLGLVLSVLGSMPDAPFRFLHPPAILHALVCILLFGLLYFRKSPPPVVLIFFGAFELLRGSIVPLLLLLVGQDAPLHRTLGSPASAGTILWIGLAVFALVSVLSLAVVQFPSHIPKSSDQLNVSLAMVLVLIAMGCVGMYLRFPSVNAILSFIAADDFRYLHSASVESAEGPLAFAANVLRPLLPLGIGLLVILRRAAIGKTPWTLWLVWATVSYMALGSYGLNRATLLIPSLAFIFCYIKFFNIQLSGLQLALGVIAGGFLFVFLGSFRSGIYAETGAQGFEGSVLNGVVQTVLLYGQSPLQTAAVIDSGYWPGSTVVASLLSPFPGVGEPWRDFTGTAVYNRTIYGSIPSRDQIMPSWLEVFLSSGWISVLAFSLIVVAMFRIAEQWLRNCTSLIEMYAAILVISFASQISITSITAVLQSLIYIALLPVGIALVSRRLSRSGSYHATMMSGTSSPS